MGLVSTNARKIMDDRCIKQSRLAEKAGFGVKEFSDLLTGRKIMREEHILLLSRALEVTPNELLGYSEIKVS